MVVVFLDVSEVECVVISSDSWTALARVTGS